MPHPIPSLAEQVPAGWEQGTAHPHKQEGITWEALLIISAIWPDLLTTSVHSLRRDTQVGTDSRRSLHLGGRVFLPPTGYQAPNEGS